MKTYKPMGHIDPATLTPYSKLPALAASGMMRCVQTGELDTRAEWVPVEEVERLKTALRQLTNVASGFESMADPFVHGHINMTVLGLRIDEARAALEAK
jgi:hypothetical protein